MSEKCDVDVAVTAESHASVHFLRDLFSSSMNAFLLPECLGKQCLNISRSMLFCRLGRSTVMIFKSVKFSSK